MAQPNYGRNSLTDQLLKGSRIQRDRVIAQLGAAGIQVPPQIAAQLLQGGSRIQQERMIAQLGNARQAAYGRGGGSVAQHFAPAPVDMGAMGDIVMDSGGQHFEQHGPSLEQAEAQAQRDAMEQEALMKQRTQAFGQMAMSDDLGDQRQGREALGIDVGQAAGGPQFDKIGGQFDQLLGEPTTPAGATETMGALITGASPAIRQEFENAAQPHVRAQMRSAAADWAAISASMGDPAVDQSQIEDMAQQFIQRHPAFSQFPPQAISKEQAAELQKKLKLAEYQQQMPGVPLDFDKDGTVRVVPGWTELQRTQTSAATAADRSVQGNATATFNARMKAAKALLPAKPGMEVGPGSPEHTAYTEQLEAYQMEVQRAHDDYVQAVNPQTAAPAAPAGPPPQQSTSLSYPNGLAAQRAFNAGQIPPGATFSVDGVKYKVDANGEPQEIQ